MSRRLHGTGQQSVIPKRLKAFETRTLLHGAHASADEGMCAMEAVAFIAGEPHSAVRAYACHARALRTRADRRHVGGDAGVAGVVMRAFLIGVYRGRMRQAIERRWVAGVEVAV